MSSRRRILASQRNGRKSRGPVTPAGKVRSSRNATRHGLLAKCCVLETESRECFDDLAHEHFARFQPVDEVESGLVEEMIAASWRLRRCWALETRTLDNEIAAQVEGDQLDRIAAGLTKAAVTHPLALMQRYETRLQMMYNRALNALLFIRTVSPAPDAPNDLPNEPNPKIEHGRVIDLQLVPKPESLIPNPQPAIPASEPSPSPLTPDPRSLTPRREAPPKIEHGRIIDLQPVPSSHVGQAGSLRRIGNPPGEQSSPAPDPTSRPPREADPSSPNPQPTIPASEPSPSPLTPDPRSLTPRREAPPSC